MAAPDADITVVSPISLEADSAARAPSVAMNNAAFVNPHSLSNKVGRVVWSIVSLTLFRPSPWFMTGWRSFLLRRFGAKIGPRGGFHRSVRVWAPWELRVGAETFVDRGVNLYNAFGIELGDRVIVSFESVLCTATHDHRSRTFPLTGKPIRIESDSWVAAQAFIAPGVTVHTGAVVGARAMVSKDVPAWTVVSGNPAKPVALRTLKD